MFAVLLSFLCSLGAVYIQGEEMHYAVVVAGSMGFVNYRHQADVCHAYHVLIKGGMAPENIILMSYDDAANAEDNPFPGKLYNQPSAMFHKAPKDVYEGCVIDYRGKQVTKEVFTAVLTGDSKTVSNLTNNANNKVLKSTKNDNVFVNFVDHGGVGLIAFPHGTMKANELKSALTKMHRKKMYKKLVFYMEACESGSMFEKWLPRDMNIYAMTAANAKESSWGTYCPPHGDMVRGKKIGTCLGDLFSVNWMQETDKEHSNGLFNMTLKKQHRYVKRTTNKSHVMIYGDRSFMNEDVDAFEGDEDDSMKVFSNDSFTDENDSISLELVSAVDSRDIRLHFFYQRYVSAAPKDRPAAKAALNEELGLRERYDSVFSKFQDTFDLLPLGSDASLSDDDYDWQCYGNVIEYFQVACQKPDLHDYVMKYYGLLFQSCTTQTESKVKEVIQQLCTKSQGRPF